jgi:hypothetical protein
MQNNTIRMGCHTGTRNKERTRQEVLEKMLEWKKHPKFGQLFNESNPLSFVPIHEQFGITYIPDIL